MSYKLFLDDVRNPGECVHYMHKRIGKDNPMYLDEWEVVRNYYEFVATIQKRGLPEVISFDHDLGPEHYDPCMFGRKEDYNLLYETFVEKTGYDCAKWLLDYCKLHKADLPKCYCHSMNPVGHQNIVDVLGGKRL